MAHLTPKQEKALAALLTNFTIQQAADAAGIGLRTLHTWLAEPVFADAYRTARRDATQHAIAQLQQSSSYAAAALRKLLTSDKPTVQLQAAKTILELSIKTLELEDVLARIERLEQAHAEKPS